MSLVSSKLGADSKSSLKNITKNRCSWRPLTAAMKHNLFERVTQFKNTYNPNSLRVDPFENRINQLKNEAKENTRRRPTALSSTYTSTPFIGQRTSSRLDDNFGFDEANDIQLENIEWHTSDLYDLPADNNRRNSVKRTSDDDIKLDDDLSSLIESPVVNDTNGFNTHNTHNTNKKWKSSENDLNDDEIIELLDETSFVSDQQMTDFYLMLSLKQCLSDISKMFRIGDRNLWSAVHHKMKDEFSFDLKNEISCQIRFEELFCKYLNVLNTAKSLSEASRQFKCYDVFDDIDWESVSDHRHSLVNEMKERLRSGANQTACTESDTNLINECMSDWSDWSE